ncbi:MAG: hypothetical protein ABI036_18645 [Fibrobacteria bacterium]
MNEMIMKILSQFEGDELISRLNISAKTRIELAVVQDQLDWLHVTGYVAQEGNFYKLTNEGQKVFTEAVERKV